MRNKSDRYALVSHVKAEGKSVKQLNAVCVGVVHGALVGGYPG